MRLINADKFLDMIEEAEAYTEPVGTNKILLDYLQDIKKAALACEIPNPIRQGKWIRNIADETYVCSECEGVQDCCSDYCAYCGAQMEID